MLEKNRLHALTIRGMMESDTVTVEKCTLKVPSQSSGYRTEECEAFLKYLVSMERDETGIAENTLERFFPESKLNFLASDELFTLDQRAGMRAAGYPIDKNEYNFNAILLSQGDLGVQVYVEHLETSRKFEVRVIFDKAADGTIFHSVRFNDQPMHTGKIPSPICMESSQCEK